MWMEEIRSILISTANNLPDWVALIVVPYTIFVSLYFVLLPPKLLAKKSKEYSELKNIVPYAKEYIEFEKKFAKYAYARTRPTDNSRPRSRFLLPETVADLCSKPISLIGICGKAVQKIRQLNICRSLVLQSSPHLKEQRTAFFTFHRHLLLQGFKGGIYDEPLIAPRYLILWLKNISQSSSGR